MKIVTKFNIGDTVYLNRNNRVSKKTIDSMDIRVTKSGKIGISYYLIDTWAEEEEVFSDKEAALQACFNGIRESCG